MKTTCLLLPLLLAGLARANAPAFTAQPADTLAGAGEDATLAAGVSGSAPLACQWYAFGGSPVAGAVTDMLVLVAVEASDEGVFARVASSAEGCVRPHSGLPGSSVGRAAKVGEKCTTGVDSLCSPRIIVRQTANPFLFTHSGCVPDGRWQSSTKCRSVRYSKVKSSGRMQTVDLYKDGRCFDPNLRRRECTSPHAQQLIRSAS